MGDSGRGKLIKDTEFISQRRKRKRCDIIDFSSIFFSGIKREREE